MLGGLVAHETVDEREGCLGDKNACEGPVEEVGVLGDGLLKTVFAMLEEDV